MSFPHFTHKNLAQTDYYVMPKFAEHVQYFSDIEGFLNKFDPSEFP